jgi:predicted nucleic acid-binding protein
MRTVFADTFFFIALLDSKEQFHTDALNLSRDPELLLVTTEWVLAEFGNAYSDPRDRLDFIAFYRALLTHPRVTIFPAESAMFKRAVDLFAQRTDKAWSLVDCISFLTMRDHNIVEALTGDHHFEQAGFTKLFK